MTPKMNMDEKRMKVAILAGAAHAMRYKEKNQFAQANEVLQHISENMDIILDNIDDPM